MPGLCEVEMRRHNLPKQLPASLFLPPPGRSRNAPKRRVQGSRGCSDSTITMSAPANLPQDRNRCDEHTLKAPADLQNDNALNEDNLHREEEMRQIIAEEVRNNCPWIEDETAIEEEVEQRFQAKIKKEKMLAASKKLADRLRDAKSKGEKVCFNAENGEEISTEQRREKAMRDQAVQRIRNMFPVLERKNPATFKKMVDTQFNDIRKKEKDKNETLQQYGRLIRGMASEK